MNSLKWIGPVAASNYLSPSLIGNKMWSRIQDCCCFKLGMSPSSKSVLTWNLPTYRLTMTSYLTNRFRIYTENWCRTYSFTNVHLFFFGNYNFLPLILKMQECYVFTGNVFCTPFRRVYACLFCAASSLLQSMIFQCRCCIFLTFNSLWLNNAYSPNEATRR